MFEVARPLTFRTPSTGGKAIELLECQVLSQRKKAPQREALRKGLVLCGELITSENLTHFFSGEVEVYAVDILSKDTLDVCVNV
jgi:hypothetical protein